MKVVQAAALLCIVYCSAYRVQTAPLPENYGVHLSTSDITDHDLLSSMFGWDNCDCPTRCSHQRPKPNREPDFVNSGLCNARHVDLRPHVLSLINSWRSDNRSANKVAESVLACRHTPNCPKNCEDCECLHCRLPTECCPQSPTINKPSQCKPQEVTNTQRPCINSVTSTYPQNSENRECPCGRLPPSTFKEGPDPKECTCREPPKSPGPFNKCPYNLLPTAPPPQKTDRMECPCCGPSWTTCPHKPTNNEGAFNYIPLWASEKKYANKEIPCGQPPCPPQKLDLKMPTAPLPQNTCQKQCTCSQPTMCSCPPKSVNFDIPCNRMPLWSFPPEPANKETSPQKLDPSKCPCCKPTPLLPQKADQKECPCNQPVLIPCPPKIDIKETPYSQPLSNAGPPKIDIKETPYSQPSLTANQSKPDYNVPQKDVTEERHLSESPLLRYPAKSDTKETPCSDSTKLLLGQQGVHINECPSSKSSTPSTKQTSDTNKCSCNQLPAPSSPQNSEKKKCPCTRWSTLPCTPNLSQKELLRSQSRCSKIPDGKDCPCKESFKYFYSQSSSNKECPCGHMSAASAPEPDPNCGCPCSPFKQQFCQQDQCDCAHRRLPKPHLKIFENCGSPRGSCPLSTCPHISDKSYQKPSDPCFPKSDACTSLPRRLPTEMCEPDSNKNVCPQGRPPIPPCQQPVTICKNFRKRLHNVPCSQQCGGSPHGMLPIAASCPQHSPNRNGRSHAERQVSSPPKCLNCGCSNNGIPKSNR